MRLPWAALSALVVAGPGLLACSATAVVADAGSDAGVDAATPLVWPELAVGSTADPTDPRLIGPGATAPDYRCLDAWDFDPPGADEERTFLVLRDGRIEAPAEGVCAHLYADDAPTASAGCAASDPVSDATGAVSFTIHGTAPIAIRLFAHETAVVGDSTIETLLVDLMPETTMGIPVFSLANLAGLPPIYHHALVPAAGILGLIVNDCTGERVYGARMRVARMDGTYVEPGPESEDPVYGYFAASGAPSARQEWTHVSGAVGMLNVPVEGDGTSYFVEIWGRLPGEEEPRVVGCTVARVEADTLTAIISLRPVRSSGPTCPGLR